MIRQTIIYILGFLLCLSIAGNIYFLLGKGIQVDKRVITNSYSSSGSFSVNVWGQYGNWKIITKEFKNKKELIEFTKSLTPIQFLMMNIIDGEIIIYPDITQTQNEKSVVK